MKNTALKEEFQKVCKWVLNENVSINLAKHVEYSTDLVNTYDAVITYIADFYDLFDPPAKNSSRDKWI